MKKLMIIAIATVFVVGMAAVSYAVDTVTQSAQATVSGVMSIEFAAGSDSTFGSGAIPWTSIDPGGDNNIVPPTGHSGTKCDTAVIAKCNSAPTGWDLKMSISGDLVGKVKYYMGQPINRNTSTATNGTVVGGIPAAGSDWPVIPASATAVYQSNNDTVNVPFGTFIGVSYGLNPVGLTTGVTYNSTITYTIATRV